jgi:hypothetical protein
MAAFARDPQLTVKKNFVTNRFEVTVDYTINYRPSELAFTEGFADSVALFEDDGGEPFGGGDDHVLNRPIRTFRPTTSPDSRQFAFSFPWDGTESGDEEVYAIVHHRRNINGLTSDTRRSNTVTVND